LGERASGVAPAGRVLEREDRREVVRHLMLREVLSVTVEVRDCCRDGLLRTPIGRSWAQTKRRGVSEWPWMRIPGRSPDNSVGHHHSRDLGSPTVTGPSGLVREDSRSRDKAGASGFALDARVAVAQASARVTP
jgi:hypothetical protein